MKFYIKQNDTAPILAATLKDADEVAVNLTGSSVRFHMREVGSTTSKVDADAVLVDASGGQVKYTWAADDTDTIGSYQAEFEVTFGDGSVETFPNNGYVLIEIIDDIA